MLQCRILNKKKALLLVHQQHTIISISQLKRRYRKLETTQIWNCIVYM